MPQVILKAAQSFQLNSYEIDEAILFKKVKICNENRKIFDMYQGKTAIITGATSGIGAAFAREFAAWGCNLFLTGRRKEKIKALANELATKYDVEVAISVVELSDERQVDRLIAEIGEIPVITALVNNAGFGKAGLFTGNQDSHHAMLMVHVLAAMRLISAVAPRMVDSHDGLIINVSSVAAYFPLPGSTTYSSTKRYLLTFSESLHMELASYGIRVQALCPGMTKTDFHMRMGEDGKRIEKRYVLGWMKPEKVAKLSLRHISSPRVVYIPGLVNKALVRIVSRMPRRLYYRLARAVLGKRLSG